MDYTVYELLRYELFEQLFPVLLFSGIKKERKQALYDFTHGGSDFIHVCFEELCKEDGVPYPYSENDFKVNYFERGGVKFVQIILPEIEPSKNKNNIFRAYLMYSEVKGSIKTYKYFVIKHFAEGDKTVIVNLVPDEIGFLGHDLTEHKGDMEYEYWKLVNDYATLIAQDFTAKGQNVYQ